MHDHDTPDLPAAAREIDGMRVARRPIFTAPINTPEWHVDMLIALDAAKKLGVRTFEIAVAGVPARGASAQQQGGYRAPHEELHMQLFGSKAPKALAGATGGTVTIFAVVVE